MVHTPKRRRFLQLSATGAVASVAGCADPFGSVGDPDDDEYAAYTTVVAEPPQTELRDLVARLVDGDVDQLEYQQEVQSMVEEATSSFESHVESNDELTIEASEPDMGLYVVDGTDDALVAMLGDEFGAQLRPGSAFNAILELQELEAEFMEQQQPQQPPGDDGEEDPDEDE